MENRNYCIVLDYICEELNCDKSKLTVNTSLSDLGLDGDDVLAFLVKFFKEFKIEYEGTNYRDFIPEERGFFVYTILSVFAKRKREDEIFIRDLILSLDKKQWNKKREYKIIFISPFSLTNKEDDNCDINIVLETGEIYFGLLMTVKNVTTLASKHDYDGYLDMVDTIVITNMEKATIKNALDRIIDERRLDEVFTKIGTLKTEGFDYSFEEINDFQTWWKDS